MFKITAEEKRFILKRRKINASEAAIKFLKFLQNQAKKDKEAKLALNILRNKLPLFPISKSAPIREAIENGETEKAFQMLLSLKK